MAHTSKELLINIEAHYQNSADLFKSWGINTSDGTFALHTGFYSDPINIQENDGVSKMTTKVIELADIGRNQRVLDAGCGMGNLTFEIGNRYAKHNVRVHGIDISSTNLHEANSAHQLNKSANVSFSKQDYLNTAFPDNTFDRVVFFESLAHAEDKPETLREMSRILKPQGKIIIADMFIKSDLDAKQTSTLEGFKKLSGIPSIENLTAILSYLSLLDLKVEVNEITSNVLLPDQDEPYDLESSDENFSDEYSIKLQGLLSDVQQIMHHDKAGYYFISATKL